MIPLSLQISLPVEFFIFLPFSVQHLSLFTRHNESTPSVETEKGAGLTTTVGPVEGEMPDER